MGGLNYQRVTAPGVAFGGMINPIRWNQPNARQRTPSMIPEPTKRLPFGNPTVTFTLAWRANFFSQRRGTLLTVPWIQGAPSFVTPLPLAGLPQGGPVSFGTVRLSGHPPVASSSKPSKWVAVRWSEMVVGKSGGIEPPSPGGHNRPGRTTDRHGPATPLHVMNRQAQPPGGRR